MTMVPARSAPPTEVATTRAVLGQHCRALRERRVGNRRWYQSPGRMRRQSREFVGEV
jgi:hypothetical protein